MPEDRLRRSMLLDYYGELLTPRQRECYELHYNDDLSLSEIAEQCGISRQGAWDNIHRASDTMEKLEAKTGLIRRTVSTDRHLRRLSELLEQLELSFQAGAGAGSGAAEAEVTPDAVALLREAREEIGSLLKTED